MLITINIYKERTEYQKIINLLDNTNNQPSKFRAKTWVEVNDDACGAYNTKVKSNSRP